MPNFTEIRDAAVALLRTRFPDLVRVEAFSGELSIDALSIKALPAGVSVLAAAIGGDNSAPAESLAFEMLGSFGVMVVSNNVQSREAGEAEALAVAEKAALALHGATFGLPGVSPAKVFSIDAVHDEELTGRGLTVWSVVWRQRLVFTGGA